MKRILMLVLPLVLSSTLFANSTKHHRQHVNAALAPGYQKLEFIAPTPGSYQLPPLGRAADAKLLNSQGQVLQMSQLLGGKYTLLSFMYTSCSDVNGCPLASYVLSKVAQGVMHNATLKNHVRLVSFSFDPLTDSPEVLAKYAAHFRGPGVDWHFVTSPSPQALSATLKDYNQFVIRDLDSQGKAIGSISHLLRVYLIDPDRQIRNIYSVSFLHPETVVNDILTLLGNPPGT